MIDFSTLTSLATVAWIFIAAWELNQSRLLAKSTFEDSFDEKYRQLAFDIPVDALLSKKVSRAKREIARESVYNYFDLSNEQTYLRTKKRVSYNRWKEWSTWIQQNLKRPFFQEILKEVEADSYETFSYLERLIAEDFKNDPAKW